MDSLENAIEDYKTNETYREIHEVLHPNLIKFLPEILLKKEALDNDYSLKSSHLKNYKKIVRKKYETPENYENQAEFVKRLV